MDNIKSKLREINNQESSKRRLLDENFKKKENHQIYIINFIKFCVKELNIDKNFKVVLTFKRDDLISTAYYNVINNLIKVYVKDRALVDIFRSIAHELVHHKQNIEGRISNVAENGSDGSLIENEANAMAGVMIRKFGKLHPEIYY